MTHEFHELLLSELRMVVYRPGDPAGLTDGLLCAAVTANENLRSLGYVLRPDDVVRLAVSPSLDGFYQAVKELVPDVKAKPIYPGFPKQVMEMDAAVFRLHQMIHYFSTYGVELLTGEKVQKGWLPGSEGPERTMKDRKLLEDRVITLIPESEAAIAVLGMLVNRRERLTNPELFLVLECVPLCTADQLMGLTVRFKENLELIFPVVMKLKDRETVLRTLRALCAHTGDVLRCAKAYLSQRRWHLTTREKKLLVRLLESYPVRNFEDNLMQSLRLRERSLLILRHLDYNRFARSLPHKEAVLALREGRLRSWHGGAEALLRERAPEALRYLAQRPGYMLRSLNRLVLLDYDPAAIKETLVPHAGLVSGHLAVKTIGSLVRRRTMAEEAYEHAVAECRNRYLWESYARPPEYEQMRWSLQYEANEKRREAERLFRWQEKEARTEAFGPVRELERKLAQAEKELSLKVQARELVESAPDALRKLRLKKNGGRDISGSEYNSLLYGMFYRDDPEQWQAVIGQLEAERDACREEADQAQEAAERLFRERTAAAQALCHQKLDEIGTWHQMRQNGLRERYLKACSEYQEKMRTLDARRDQELNTLRDRHQQEQIRIDRCDTHTVGVLKALLREHYRLAETPLKGRKVFQDLARFDLKHSVLETEDRSKDGGYVRSGISFRIPEKARYVRFFVYWNDRERVDIDLHAGGKTVDGADLHIGWNADFCESGVVHSGDITHSDAAEYIDIDLTAPVREIYANVDLFSGKCSFRHVETCYVGLMAVSSIGETVSLYDPKNCFFTHRLTQNTDTLYYGYIDVQNRFVRFVGQPDRSGWASRPPVAPPESVFSLKDYLDCVLDAQGAVQVSSREEADVILTMEKSASKKAVSLVENDFFLGC